MATRNTRLGQGAGRTYSSLHITTGVPEGCHSGAAMSWIARVCEQDARVSKVAGHCPLIPIGNSIQRSRTTNAPAVLQSGRDSVCPPRAVRSVSNPNGVAARFHGLATTPLGVVCPRHDVPG